MNQLGRLVILSSTLLFLAPVAVAQEEGEVRYQKRTVIDFDEINVEGELARPHGDVIMEPRRPDFSPLLRVRTDFDLEMRYSVDEVK